MNISKQTKKCSKCKEDIQPDAKKCKHCGSDLKNWFVRHKILTGLLVLFVIGIIGNIKNDTFNDSSISSNNTASQKEENKEVTIKITARELYVQYEANEIQADDKYKNKLLEISGVIENIGKDILDDPYITLKTDNVFGSIQCMLADSEKSKASQLQKSTPIVLEGKNTGKLLNIIIRDCKIK